MLQYFIYQVPFFWIRSLLLEITDVSWTRDLLSWKVLNPGGTLPRNHRKYLSTAITRNFSMNNSESRTAMWAALQKFRSKWSNPRTNVTSHLPIIELVLFGRAWWMSYLTSSQVSDCKILNNYHDDYPKKLDNFNDQHKIKGTIGMSLVESLSRIWWTISL